MSMRGRPNKHYNLKKQHGTERPDRMQGILKFELITEIPPPPEMLTSEAKEIWVDICEKMVSARILEVIDVHLMAILCEQLATVYRMTEKIKKHGEVYVNNRGNLVKTPYVDIRNVAMKEAVSVMGQMGISPSMRQRYGYSSANDTTERVKKISLYKQ